MEYLNGRAAAMFVFPLTWLLPRMIEAYCIWLAMVCGLTAIIDMGMNGARYAEWAPYGLGIALVSSEVAWLLD